MPWHGWVGSHLLPQVQVTGRSGIAGHHARALMTRAGFALAALAASSVLVTGCGGGGSSADVPPAATAPTGAKAPIAVAAVGLGGTVAAGPTTPAPVAKALAGSGVVVISFVVKGAADDDSVAAAIATVRADPRSSKDVAFFDYTVGEDHFGDLADLLGVTGTPSVAVIGRDRTLVNLWTGLVDADILRQSIADATDTTAAHAGTKAASSSASGTAPTGDAAGIALAKKVNAVYRAAPGFSIKGSVPVSGAGTLKIDATVALDNGTVTATSGTFTVSGASFQMAVTPTSGRIRSTEASCWASVPGGASTAATTPRPGVAFAGARVSKPREEGASRLLDITVGGQSMTYVIDADARVTELRTKDGSVAFELLDSAPSVDPGTPVCDNPADALQGLPAALGGTS